MDAKETTIFQAVLIASLFLGGIVLLFILSILRQHRRNVRLYKSKIEAEITTLENERERIATDLHDELGPLLSSAKFKLASIESISVEDAILVQQASNHIDDIIHRIREISNGLMPNTLLRKGVSFAIEEFIHSIGEACTFEIDFTRQSIPFMPQQKAIHLYRIMQEIINNTIKHARATRLTIRLFSSPTHLLLSTEDDGIGFNNELGLKESNGFGLRNLLSRTELLGGQISIASRPGSGTSINIRVPIAALKSSK